MKAKKKPFLIALGVSLLLHLLVVTGPAWELPTLADWLEANDGPPLEAHLVAHPGPVAAKPKRPKPRPKPAPPPVDQKVSHGDTPLVTPAPVAETAPDGVADAATPTAGEGADDGAPDALPNVAMTLPGFVRITYRVTMGEAGFLIGSAEQELRHDDKFYSMRHSAETRGLVWLLKPVKIVDVSSGDVVATGLRPREFWSRRDNGKGDSAHLDWDKGEVRIDNGKTYPLEAGTQDMLSMFAQLTLMDFSSGELSLPVATGKKVERYEFTVLGQERIVTPRGERNTLHLRNRQPDSKEATEIWLGLDDGRLPIKIRHIDKRGDIFDQIAERIDYQ